MNGPQWPECCPTAIALAAEAARAYRKATDMEREYHTLEPGLERLRLFVEIAELAVWGAALAHDIIELRLQFEQGTVRCERGN